MKLQKNFYKNYSIKEHFDLLIKKFSDGIKSLNQNGNIMFKKDEFTLVLNEYNNNLGKYIEIELPYILDMFKECFINYTKPEIIYVFVDNEQLVCKNLFTNKKYIINNFYSNELSEGYFYTDIFNIGILNNKTINHWSKLIVKENENFVLVKRGKELKFSLKRDF